MEAKVKGTVSITMSLQEASDLLRYVSTLNHPLRCGFPHVGQESKDELCLRLNRAIEALPRSNT